MKETGQIVRKRVVCPVFYASVRKQYRLFILLEL